jgi:hypothetical protein
MTDRFFDVARTLHRTSAGLVELPILYHDASNVIALFQADARGAARLLEGTGLEPALGRGARALVGLSFYAYRRTTVGVYNEVGTAIFARRPGDRGALPALAEMLMAPARRRVGAWVVDLPVTTEAACAAGRELWGYPKFVTEIDFSLTGRAFQSVVHDPQGGARICAIEGTMGRGLAVPALSLVTFSKLDDALVRTHVDVRAPTRAHAPGDVRLSVGASAHRMAENLRLLGLDGARPELLVITERFQSLLHAGRRAG